MPRGVIDISVIGDKELVKMFERVEAKVGRKFAATAMRNSAKRLRPKIAANTPVDTGKLKAGMARAKVRSASKKRDQIRIGLAMPTRAELGIPADAEGYYPYVLEYGTSDGRIPPRRFIRGTVDANKDVEWAAIGKEIGAAIEKEARK